MHEITKQSVLAAFKEYKQISWDDFTEKEIFYDIGPESDRSIQLRNALADLIKDKSIMRLKGIRPAWSLVTDSLNPAPLPKYRIPFNIELDGQEKSGELQPVDNKEPCRTYLIWVDKDWLGTLHNFNDVWHFDNQQYQHIKDELGKFVILWHE